MKYRVLLKRGTENGTEWKTGWNWKRNKSFEGKQNEFRDTAAYKGKRFEIKQNLDF